MSRNLRERLQEFETDKKNIIHNIQKLESQIYEFEGSYLKETGAYGNAVKVGLNFKYLKNYVKRAGPSRASKRARPIWRRIARRR